MIAVVNNKYISLFINSQSPKAETIKLSIGASFFILCGDQIAVWTELQYARIARISDVHFASVV